MTLDLGQGEDLTNVRERALAIGAVRAHVIDAREEFARDYVLPALQARAIYEDGYPLASALGRPLIAKHLVAIARMEGAGAVAHGCTGKDNDQVGLDISVRALDASLELIAPAREWDMSRSDEIEYARVRNMVVPVTIGQPVQRGFQSVGPFNRMRRAGGCVAGAARRHLHVDPIAAALS